MKFLCRTRLVGDLYIRKVITPCKRKRLVLVTREPIVRKKAATSISLGRGSAAVENGADTGRKRTVRGERTLQFSIVGGYY